MSDLIANIQTDINKIEKEIDGNGEEETSEEI